jgi:hypothetical protein
MKRWTPYRPSDYSVLHQHFLQEITEATAEPDFYIEHRKLHKFDNFGSRLHITFDVALRHSQRRVTRQHLHIP